MKKLLITIGILTNITLGYPQQFINGDLNFINPNQPPIEYFNTDWTQFNNIFEGASWYGTAKVAYRIYEYNVNGNTAASISFHISNGYCYYSNLSVELDEPLQPGVTYRLTYEERGDLDTPMKIELSKSQNTPGEEIGQTYTSNLHLDNWRSNQIEFTATDTFQYFNFVLDYESSQYTNSGRDIDKFHLDIINNPINNINELNLDYLKKYNVYSIDGKILFYDRLINTLPNGMYILENNNQTFKLIK